MGTLPTTYGNFEAQGATIAPVQTALPHAPTRAERRTFELRPLPFEDVFFYSKKIDNSRLVREADPKSRGACWSAIGAAALVVGMLTGAMAPAVKVKLAGYRLEALRGEERRLLDERKALELEEAELLNPARLERLARRQNLVTPSLEQVVHLEGKPDGAVAMVK
jgi:hypothetical protein